MELIQLLSFYQIVRTGSFSRAAESVYRSQSAVSHQVKELEKELRVNLFDRIAKKKVKLTEEGEMLFSIVNTFFNEMENLKKSYADMQYGRYGELNIAVTRNAMNYYLVEVIKLFIRQFPGIKYKLFTRSDAIAMQEMVINGDADFGIGMKDRLISKNLNFLFWRTFGRVLMTDRCHPLCKKKTLTLLEVAKYPLMLTRLGSTKKVVAETFARHNISYEIAMEVDSPDTIKKFLKDSIGVSIFSSIVVTEEDKNDLAIFNVEHLFGKVEYGIYYSNDKFISSVMRKFIKFFAPEIANELPSSNE